MAIEVAGITSSVRRELASGLQGQVVYPDDHGYDVARSVLTA
jgi:hypothetical protein